MDIDMLWILCNFHQVLSLATFSHAEYVPQTVVVAIYLRIKPCPTVQLTKLHISWQISNEFYVNLNEYESYVSSQT